MVRWGDYNATAGNAAWGEEVTDCFETASMLIATLAASFQFRQNASKLKSG
jgi:hypothetical protein